MTAEDLKNLVRVRKPQLQLVIISACNSRQTAQVMGFFLASASSWRLSEQILTRYNEKILLLSFR